MAYAPPAHTAPPEPPRQQLLSPRRYTRRSHCWLRRLSNLLPRGHSQFLARTAQRMGLVRVPGRRGGARALGLLSIKYRGE